jgi:hypothetical protein
MFISLRALTPIVENNNGDNGKKETEEGVENVSKK